jgi:rhamnosyltransferase
LAFKNQRFITVRDNDVLLGHRVGDGKRKIIGKIDVRIPSPIRHY